MTQKKKKLYGLLFSRSRVIISSTCRHLKEKIAKIVLPTFFYLFFIFWESSDLCVRVYVCVDPRIPFRLSKCLLKDASDILVRFTSTSNMALLCTANDWTGEVFLFKEKKNTSMENETLVFVRYMMLVLSTSFKHIWIKYFWHFCVPITWLLYIPPRHQFLWIDFPFEFSIKRRESIF